MYVPAVLQEHQVPVWKAFMQGFNIMLCCGRKFGKTVLLCVMAVYSGTKMGQRPERTRILFASAAYSNIMESYMVCCDFLRIAGIPHKAKQSPHMEIKIGNCIITFASMQSPDANISNIFQLILLDEAAVCSDISVYRLLPTQMRYSKDKPQIVMASTPRGPNWFKARWESAQDARFKMSSWACKFNHPDTLRKLESQMTRREALTELYAQFQACEGTVFNADEMQFWSGKAEDLYQGEQVIALGVDLASRADWTVMIPVTNMGRMLIPKRIQKRQWPVIIGQINEYTHRWPDALVYIDGTGLGTVITDILRPAITNLRPIVYTNESKNRMVSVLEVAIEKHEVWFPDYKPLRDEFASFGYELSKAGKYTYGAQKGNHDDIINACMLAGHALKANAQYKDLPFTAPKDLAVDNAHSWMKM